MNLLPGLQATVPGDKSVGLEREQSADRIDPAFGRATDVDNRIGRLVHGDDVAGEHHPLAWQEHGNVATTVSRSDMDEDHRNAVERHRFGRSDRPVGQSASLDLLVGCDEGRLGHGIVRRSNNLGADVFVRDDRRIGGIGG